MKRIIKSLIPGPLLRAYHSFRLRREARREARRDAARAPAEVFSDIYRKNRWGGAPGTFCSGAGSSDPRIVDPYVACVSEFLRNFPADHKPRLVDLGCGDFTVGRRLLDLCREYVGIDVVPELIAHLRATVNDPRVRFECLDVTSAELPAGDVCFIRQVLQHLSNAQISAVLPRLARYPTVFVTEHYPAGPPKTPNLDKVHGADIRLDQNSGVYLGTPPFELPGATLELVLEVPDGAGPPYPPGVIRTFRLTHPAVERPRG